MSFLLSFNMETHTMQYGQRLTRTRPYVLSAAWCMAMLIGSAGHAAANERYEARQAARP